MNRFIGPLPVLAAAAVALLVLPLLGLVVMAPWGEILRSPGAGGVGSAVGVSLLSTTVATVIVATVGVPLGWTLARDPRWQVVRPLVLLPLLLPPVVAGLALQLTWGREGLLGGGLAAFGVLIPFSLLAVVIAQVFVALPWCVLAVETGVRAVDPRMEEMAQLYGMTTGRVLRRVTLPLVRRSIAAGILIAWARALGEFGATFMFAGNLPGRTQTMPLALYLDAQTNPSAAALLAILHLLISAGVLVALRGRLGFTS